jgi:hypothetical protein
MATPKPAKTYWLDDPANIKKVVYALAASCAAVVVADFFYDKHVHYWFEKLPGFHALFGFVSAFFLVLTAKELRKVLMRPEDYYDR